MNSQKKDPTRPINFRRICLFVLIVVLMLPSTSLANGEAMQQESPIEHHSFFTDVQKDDYFAEALHFFTLTDLLPPVDNDLFRPRQPITRREFFLWLHSFLQITDEGIDVKDVDSAAHALIKLGLITGYEDGSLRLNSTISRAEVAVILQRVLQLETSAISLGKFTDVEPDIWYSEAIGALANYKLIQGKSHGLFAPHDLITKAEAITLLYRALYQGKQIEDIQGGQLIINGQAFDYHPDLAGLFAESNRSALLNASIEYSMRDGVIETITSLYLNNRDEDSFSLDGHGATIQGDLFVTRPTVSLSNLNIEGDLFVTSEVTDSFTSDAVEVEGFTFIMPASMNNNNTATAMTSLPIYAHDTSFGGLILSRNIHLQSFQKDTDLVGNKPLARKKTATMKIASTQTDDNLLEDLDEGQQMLRENVLDALLRQKEIVDQELEDLLRDLDLDKEQGMLRENVMEALLRLTMVADGKITQSQLEEIYNNAINTISSPEDQYRLDRQVPNINNNTKSEQDLREEMRQRVLSEIEQRQSKREESRSEREQRQREIEERLWEELEQRQREREEKNREREERLREESEERQSEEIEETEHSGDEQDHNVERDIDYEFIIIGTLDHNEQDPPLEIELEESEQPIVVISDTQLSTTDEGDLASVYLVDVTHFTVEGNIEHLVIEQQEETETTLAGTGQIGEVELRSGGQVNIAVQGEIDRLVISNPQASIHLDENTIINNIELAEGVELEDVIQNIEDIESNIRNINGEPYSPPAKNTPSTGDGGSNPPSYSGEPQIVKATFESVTGSVYADHAKVSGTIDGIKYTFEIVPGIGDNVGDTITFTIKRILLEQADTVTAVEVTGLGDRIVTPTLSIPINLSVNQVTFYERVGEHWNDRYTSVNHAQKTVQTDPTIYDSTFAIAVAEKVLTPDNIQATQVTADSVTLTWDEVAGATGYQIYRYHETIGSIPLKVVETTSFTDTGLTSDTEYGYDIYAMRNNFKSHTSARVDVTTK